MAFLLAVTIWACCRFYYYLFYVLERYLGREQRFAGVGDALGFLLKTFFRRPPARLTSNLLEHTPSIHRESPPQPKS